jgi:4-amino-4-deoxy-L-arabinose transferase-like glycosyltransferase
LDAGTCVLLAGLARLLWGGLAGWVCGLMAAAYYGLFASCGLVLSEPLCVFLWSCALYALYRPKASPAVRAVTVGLALGGAFLVRPEALLFAPFAAGLLRLLWPQCRWRHAALCLLCFGMTAAPWAIRNQLVLGRPVLTTTQGHAGAYVGLWLPLHEMGQEPRPYLEAAGGEKERDEAYARELTELRREVPLRRAALAYGYNLATLFYPFLPQYDLTFVFWIPFWLFGLWRCRREPRFLPIAGLLVGLAAVYTFFGGPVSRYRQNLAPAFVLLAGLGASALSGLRRPLLLSRGIAVWFGLNAAIWQFAPWLRQGASALKALVWG